MKKTIFILSFVLFLMACQNNNSASIIKDETMAMNVLLSYVSSDPHVKELLPNFAPCQLKYKKGKQKRDNSGSVDAYTCTAPLGNTQEEILVISDAQELKNEINPNKKQEKNFVYIALLIYDKETKQIKGTKLLFDIKNKRVSEYGII